MLTPEEKMKQVQLAMLDISAVNNVLIDAIQCSDYSGEGDYLVLLDVQKDAIRKITNLF